MKVSCWIYPATSGKGLMVMQCHHIDLVNYYKSVLTSVGWECKVRSRCPRKNSGWRVCWRRITLVIRSYWRVVGATRRRTASSGSPRVSQISGWSRVRGRKLSRLGL